MPLGLAAGNNATVVYSTRAGVPRPVDAPYSFKGRLLGRASGNQGNEAVRRMEPGNLDRRRHELPGGWLRRDARRGPAGYPAEPEAGEGSQAAILPNQDILGAERAADSTATPPITASAVPSDNTQVGPDYHDPHHGTDMADTRGQTIAGGILTVTGRMYDTTYVVDTSGTPSVTTNGNPIGDDFSTEMNEGKYQTHEIDLAAAVDGGVKWSNGDKHVDLAKAVIEKQLRILESDIGLGDTVKEAAWQAVQDAIMDHLFGVKWDGNTVLAANLDTTTAVDTPDASTATRGNARADLPGDLGNAYNADRNDDFVRAAAEALEALANNDALKAALGNGGIFKGLAKANAKSNENAAIADTVNLIDRRNSRVQYAIGSTAFTRFGAWRRETSSHAEAMYARRTETAQGDGPNSLAYSQLADTEYQGLADPRYPGGARMTYEGSTIAVLGNAFFEGAVNIEVLWDQAAGLDGIAGNADDNDDVGATLNMSIRDIENMADASPLYLDNDTTANAATDKGDLLEVASIEIGNLVVTDTLALRKGDTTAGETASTAAISALQLGTLAPTEGTIDIANVSVGGQFVGQGVSGPLAVIGTWAVSSNAVTITGGGAGAIGAKVENKNDAGNVTGVSVTGLPSNNGTFAPVSIHGGFGAELP